MRQVISLKSELYWISVFTWVVGQSTELPAIIELDTLMINIEQELLDIGELISLPEIYLKVRRLMDDDASDMNDFADIISVDPNLSARLLKLVNSAYFGLSEPIDSIPRALNMIGIDQLHSMALGVASISALDLPNEILPLRPFWHRSLYTGVLARFMADQLKIDRSDRLFLAGLLHEIGNLVLCARFPDQAREAVMDSVRLTQPLHEVQYQLLGCHYGDIGAMLMTNWNMPGELQALIRYQPEPKAATEQQLEIALLHLAHACASSDKRADVDMLIDADVRAMIGLTQQEIFESSDMSRMISVEMGKVILG